MKDAVVSLSRKNRNNMFLKNQIEFKCRCGHSHRITYYDFLTSGEFSIGESTTAISPFISEAIYDETISITPIRLSKKCPGCGNDITAVFPISLEELMPLLQKHPPDPQMYG